MDFLLCIFFVEEKSDKFNVVGVIDVTLLSHQRWRSLSLLFALLLHGVRLFCKYFPVQASTLRAQKQVSLEIHVPCQHVVIAVNKSRFLPLILIADNDVAIS